MNSEGGGMSAWWISEQEYGSDGATWDGTVNGTIEDAWDNVRETIGLATSASHPDVNIRMTAPGTAEVTYWVDGDDGPQRVDSTVTVWEG